MIGSVAALGYVTYRYVRRRQVPSAGPFNQLPPPPEGESPSGCAGPQYPGFVFDRAAGGCMPSAETPAGIYMIDNCSDFLIQRRKDAQGEDIPSPQTAYLEALAAYAAATDPNADPIDLAARFLDMFWPQCEWPPPVEAAARVHQLFMWLATTIGEVILEAGGRVYGFDHHRAVEEALQSRFAELGFPAMDPALVPDLLEATSQ